MSRTIAPATIPRGLVAEHNDTRVTLVGHTESCGGGAAPNAEVWQREKWIALLNPDDL